MCLIIDKRKHKKRNVKKPETIGYFPKEAKRDIPVYKCINSHGKSPIMGFFYKRGVLYETQMKVGKIKASNTFESNKGVVGQGFHACLIRTPNRQHAAIIPKGALYYLDKDGIDVVSNKIIICKNQ